MAVRFDADGESYLQTSMGLGTGPVTILCWAKIVTNRNNYSTPFCLNNPSNGTALLIQTDTDGLSHYGYFQNSAEAGSSTTSATGVATSEWWALALVWNGSPGRVYWKPSGGSVSTFTVARGGTINGLTRLEIGDSSFGAEWFNGSLANFKVFSAALSQAEVEAEWASWDLVRSTNRVAHYRWRNAIGTTDDSGNGKTLTGGSGAVYDSDNPPITYPLASDLTKFFLSAV